MGLAFPACDGEPSANGSGAGSSAKTAVTPSAAPLAPRPFNDLASGYARQALGALERFDAEACKVTTDYLELRSAVFAGKAWWRVAEREASEVLLGPERPSVEGGGWLGALDATLESGDCKEAPKQVFQIRSALRLIEVQLERFPESRARYARRLSFMAAELGGVLLESTPEVSLFQAGVRADARGLLRGLREGAPLLGAKDTEALTRQLDTLEAQIVPSSDPSLLAAPALTGRADLVRKTGPLGLEIRRLIRTGTYSPTREIDWPFQPDRIDAYQDRLEVGERSDVAVSVLSLPAPPAVRAGGSLPPKTRVALGKRLFFDKRLSKGNSRSCATCHDPKLGYADAKPRAISLDPMTPTLRNVPGLLYTANQASFLWDGRLLTAKRQAQRVIHSRAEMGLSEQELVERLSKDPDLLQAFEREFAEGVTAENAGAALSAFQAAQLSPGETPLDRFARGQAALDPELSAGLDLFSSKARCGRCHIPPLFAGTRPNDFAISVFAAIGVTDKPNGKRLDGDPGRYEVTRSELDRHVFKTPTVRDIALTAPYFHNGAFKTLEEVVDFYDQGGARGLGIELENQDPDVRKLELTPEEKRLLLKFMREGLGDPKEALKLDG